MAKAESEVNKPEVAKDEPKTVAAAKAGKRSAKSLKETEAKLAKEERKTHKDSPEASQEPAKTAVKPPRSRLERRSKKYSAKYALIDKTKRYTLDEAVDLIGKTSPVKFDATVELHIRLNVDPRQADQNIRDSVLLPAGTGKVVRVAAFVDADNEAVAKAAGADLIGEDKVIKVLESGNLSFDVLIATPSQMPKLGKYARLLGPRGLMPNPKSGTVTTDVNKAVSEAKAGKVEYRVDSTGIVHIGIGKVSFKPNQLKDNLEAVLASIQNNKPASIKSTYILSSYLTSSMGPSLSISL